MKKDLVKLGDLHYKLVNKLKESLTIGQLGFIKAAEYLYEIKTKKTYTFEDSTQQIKFHDFLKRPDLPIPGRTVDSKIRIAQMLIKIYEVFKSKYNCDNKLLAEVGYTKLNLIAPVIEKYGDLEDWISKAKNLSECELGAEIRTKDKTLADLMSCKHEDIKQIKSYRCEGCGTVWRNDPRLCGNV